MTDVDVDVGSELELGVLMHLRTLGPESEVLRSSSDNVVVLAASASRTGHGAPRSLSDRATLS
jgi:hypothetical protein